MKNVFFVVSVAFILFGCKKSDNNKVNIATNSAYKRIADTINLSLNKKYLMSIYDGSGQQLIDTIIFNSDSSITENGKPDPWVIGSRDTSITYKVNVSSQFDFTSYSVLNNSCITISQNIPHTTSLLQQYMGSDNAFIAFYNSGPMFNVDNKSKLGIELKNYVGNPCYAILSEL